MHELERLVREECAKRASLTPEYVEHLAKDIRPEMFELYEKNPDTVYWTQQVRGAVASKVLFAGLGAAVTAYCKATGAWR